MNKLYFIVLLFSFCEKLLATNPPDAISLSLGGSAAAYSSTFCIQYNAAKVGGVLQYRKLSIPIRQSSEPFSYFSFQGDNYLKNGIYYDAVFRNINLFAEWSYCFSNLTLAQNHGALISIHRKLDLSILYRNYHPGFITFQTNGFWENSNAKNEKGLYLGYRIKLKKYFSIVGYYDLFQNLNSQFKSIAPSRGFYLWTELRYKPSKIFNAYYRFRKEKNKLIVQTNLFIIMKIIR